MDAIAMSIELLTTSLLALMAVIGTTFGIFGGSMRGVSPFITVALLLPFTFTMEPVPALAMQAATYMSEERGSSIPVILI